MSEWHPLAITIMSLLALAVPLTIGAAIVKIAQEKKGPRSDSAPPLPSLMISANGNGAEDPLCPCGLKATKALPRARVIEVPILGRLVRRQHDAFAELRVCDLHADVAAAYLDEQIAAARLHDARSERDRLAALANQALETMSAVVSHMPEEAQRRHARSLRPGSVVRVLRTANGGEENGDS